MTQPVTEQELHRYIDGQLQAARLVAVEAYLARNPEEAERVAVYREQNMLLQALGAEMNGDLPAAGEEKLRRSFAERQRRRALARRGRIAAMAAALVVAASLGAAGTAFWPRDTALPAEPFGDLADTATQSFYADADAKTGGEPKLDALIDHRLGTSLRLPDLSQKGFALASGRLVATPRGPSVQLVYRDKTGRQLMLLLATETNGQSMPHVGQPPQLFYTWNDGPVSVAVGGGLGGDELRGIAEVAQRSLQPPPPPPPHPDVPAKPPQDAHPQPPSRT
jgi:anti-sigma factor RsiW